MWRAKVQVEGRWQELDLIPIETGLPRSTVIRDRFRSRFPDAENVIGYLNVEAESVNTNASRNAIQLWSKEAEEASREFGWQAPGRVERIGDALSYYDTDTAEPATIVWHDETSVIVRVTDDTDNRDFEIEYVPSARDENRVVRIKHQHASAIHTVETILDWRGYFGAQSAIIDGWTQFQQAAGRYFVRLRSRAGYLVGSVLRRITRKQLTLENDPTREERRIEMCQKYRNIAESYQDLSLITPVQHDRTMVFVHGTMSCGIQGLKDLPNLAVPTYRYEHDTFHSLQRNGIELADLISTNLKSPNLLLVAHSRGGLVARLAMAELARRGYSADMQLFTFGTPHAGTPLVNVGSRALNMLFKLGEEIVNGVPFGSLLGKSYSLLMDAPTLPPGVEVMKQSSDALAILNTVGNPNRILCWGSRFDIQSRSSGFGVEVQGALFGAMGDIAHDLVVPTESAFAFGTRQQELSCSHLCYFQTKEVQDAISSFAGQPVAASATGVTTHPSQPAAPSLSRGKGVAKHAASALQKGQVA